MKMSNRNRLGRHEKMTKLEMASPRDGENEKVKVAVESSQEWKIIIETRIQKI